MTNTSATPGRVQLRGIDFAYRSQGSTGRQDCQGAQGAQERRPVVLNAHGLTSSMRGALDLGLDFSAVARHSHLVSYDARGHGQSTGTPDPRYYSWAALAQDLLALAGHFSPDEPVAAIGCSMGTGTLLHAVTQQPGRFSRLVLTAAPTGWETRAAQAGTYRAMADLAQSDPGRRADMSAAGPVVPIFAGVPGFPPAVDVDPDLLPTVLRGASLSDLPPVCTLAGVTQPTLILAWAGDPAHPIESAQRLAQTLPDAELVVTETYDEMRQWGERIAAFLG